MVNWKIICPSKYTCVLSRNNYRNSQKEINLVLWWDGYYISPEQEAKLDIREWTQDHALEGIQDRNGARSGITLDRTEALLTINFLKTSIESGLLRKQVDDKTDDQINEILQSSKQELGRDSRKGTKFILLICFKKVIKCDIRWWANYEPTKKGIRLNKNEALKVIEYSEKALENKMVWEREM